MKKIGIVGCGAIGQSLAWFIKNNLKRKAVVEAIYDVDEDKARRFLSGYSKRAKFLALAELIKKTDLVIEAAGQLAAVEAIKKCLQKRREVIVLSSGALISFPQLKALAQKKKTNIYLPSGAVAGIDGISSLGLGKIKSFVLTTSKPPQALGGIKFLKKRKIDVAKEKKEVTIFEGRVYDAVKYFPKNINVAATLSLAANYKDLIIKIKLSPKIKRNIHRIELKAEEGSLTVEIANFPSPLNPKTSFLAILSTQALLKKMFSYVKVGT